MGGGIPNFPQSRFPGDKYPTIFRPSSPKLEPKNMESTKFEKYTDDDTASLASAKSFSSTVALLKTKTPKFMKSTSKPTSSSPSVRIMSPEERVKMQAASAARSKASSEQEGKESLRSRSAEKKQLTAEAMAVHFTLK